jgi:AcrR family transcriptional regulator
MVDPGPAHVKSGRTYDSSRRRAAEEANRRRVLDVARDLFLAEGYAATTVPRVAARAGVSVKSVYRLASGKTGLVRALCGDALLGEGLEPAEQRSDRLATDGVSGRELVRGWTELMCEVSPRISPLHLLVRASAAADLGMAGLLTDLDAARLTRMTANARRLLATDGVRPDVTLDEAAEVLWLYSAPEWYERLVLQRGWPVRRYAEFVGAAIAAALLHDRPAGSS